MDEMGHGRVVAVIDVGSNSVRLLVARELSPLAFEVIDEERFDARLAMGQKDGILSPEGIERGLRALRIVTQVARSHAPSILVAAGTEALRRAPNAVDFVDEVAAQTGVRIRILSGREEAFASFLGVVNSTSIRDGYLVDIGGGSLELMRIKDRVLVESRSAPLGAIYAAERFLKSDPATPREVRALRKAVRQALDVSSSQPVLFGVGGAIRNLARYSRLRRNYPLRRVHGFAIPRSEFRRLTTILSQASVEGRRKTPGINSWRADIIHAPAIVVDEVMKLTGAAELVVSGQGLREGLVWQELRGEAAVLPDVRGASVSGLARANGVDERAAEPAVHAAAALFDATMPLHGLDASDRDLLLAAARLATIGMHVDFYNRDRHAEYLLHSGDLHGYSHREVILLASIVRWAQAGTPDLAPYRTLIDPSDTQRALVLATLLGAARAVRRRSPSPVHGLSVVLKDDCLRIKLTGGDSLDVEAYEFERQQKRLEHVLKTRVSLSIQ